MSTHRFSYSFLGDTSNHSHSVVEGVRAHVGVKPRGPNAKANDMLRKLTGRSEFNVINVEAAVAARMAKHKSTK